MVQPRQELLGSITLLDRDGSGTVSFNGANLSSISEIELSGSTVTIENSAPSGDLLLQSGSGVGGTITLNTNSTDRVVVSDDGIQVIGIAELQGELEFVETSDPGTPATNSAYMWLDSADGKLKVRKDNGDTFELTT